MEIFGIGPLELILIVFLALIILGPKEMMATSKKGAAWLRKLRQSDIWKTTKEVMDIPTQVIKESGLDKEIQEIKSISRQTLSPGAWQGDVLPHEQKILKDDRVAATDQTDHEIPTSPKKKRGQKAKDQDAA